jgi:hypothetical protein
LHARSDISLADVLKSTSRNDGRRVSTIRKKPKKVRLLAGSAGGVRAA